RRITFLLASIAIACSGPRASAQEWARKMFRDTSHDFGTVAAGARAEYRFVVTNLFKETVHIEQATANCACIKAIVTKPVARSRESTEILAVLDTTNFKGQRNVAITVTIDQPFPAQVQPRVNRFIRTDDLLRPGSVNFGQLRSGAPPGRPLGVLS